MTKPLVVLGLLGSNLDQGKGETRFTKWRPSVDLCRHPDLPIARLDLLHGLRDQGLAERVAHDVEAVSPDTRVVLHPLRWRDPWDFEEVYTSLFELVRGYPFDEERESYMVHITTGTHVAQICWFLLTESRHVPGQLVQCSPARGVEKSPGTYRIIDLDLGRYDLIARRFREERRAHLSSLKAGIATKNAVYNALIEQIEQVAVRSRDPMVLTGPTGAGKTQLAARIYELKRERQRLRGAFVPVNCATLRGDQAMSTLFGHVRGAFTGAQAARAGLLRAAHEGVLFLDEIAELGLDEQAMLLRAIEEKTFLPLGSDKPVQSDFQLLVGTHQDLAERVRKGRFREDLLARIKVWSFALPGLRERPEDLEPNLDFELERFGERTGERITINREARALFLTFARSERALWRASFRDFSAAITRMGTLAPRGRIDEATVRSEIERLEAGWRETEGDAGTESDPTLHVLGARAADLDRFDRAQLAEVLRVCRTARSLSEAGRTLFAVSRTKKQSGNDADRLRKYLARFDLRFEQLTER